MPEILVKMKKIEIIKKCLSLKIEECSKEINFSTYKRYFSYWYWFVIIIILLINVISEVIRNVYIRILSIVQEFS